MNKTPLPQQLGFRYMRDMYHGAYFQKGDKLHMAIDFLEGSNTVAVNTLDLNDENPRWINGEVSANEITDFTVFQYPKLGYRQITDKHLGNVVMHFEATRSTRRGLQDQLLVAKALPVYDAAVYAGRFDGENLPNTRRAKALFRPEFTKFSVGIAKILAGDALGFAISEDVALGVSVNRAADAFVDVYYRGRQVGTVDRAGTVTIQNKILQRLAAKQSLFT